MAGAILTAAVALAGGRATLRGPAPASGPPLEAGRCGADGGAAAPTPDPAMLPSEPGRLGSAWVGRKQAGYRSRIRAYGPYRMPDSGTVEGFRTYLAGGSAPQDVWMALYTNDESARPGEDRPGRCVAASSRVTVAAGQPPRWVLAPAARPARVDPGWYWIAISLGETGDARIFFDENAATEFHRALRAGAAPVPESFGSPHGSAARRLSSFLEYAVVPLPPPGPGRIRLRPREEAGGAPLPGPLSGAHRWQGGSVAPIPSEADDYYRFDWAELEPRKGVYDFSPIRRRMRTAAARGQRFALRIRAMRDPDRRENPGREAAYVPAYIRDDSATYDGWHRAAPAGVYVPDWNNPALLARWRALVDALAGEFGDTAFAWLDIGFYGQYGEWTMYRVDYDREAPAGQRDATDATLQAVVDHFAARFPRTPKVFNVHRPSITEWILEHHPGIGVRADAFGASGSSAYSSHLWGRHTLRTRRLLRERRFTMLRVGEWSRSPDWDGDWPTRELESQAPMTLSNGNFASANGWNRLAPAQREQVLAVLRGAGYRYALSALELPDTLRTGESQTWTADWFDRGVNAAFGVEWRIEYSLRDPVGGAVGWRGHSTLGLAAGVLPTGLLPVRHSDRFTLPAGLEGRWEVYVRVLDAGGVRRPMALPHPGRAADGAYPVGAVVVGRGREASRTEAGRAPQSPTRRSSAAKRGSARRGSKRGSTRR